MRWAVGWFALSVLINVWQYQIIDRQMREIESWANAHAVCLEDSAQKDRCWIGGGSLDNGR